MGIFNMFDNILDDLPEKYPCPACAELKIIKISKKNKPYYFCDYCGVQVFVRGIMGINNLIQIKKTDALRGLRGRPSENDYFGLIKHNHKITFLQSKLNELYDKEDDYGLSEKEQKALKHMEEKLEELENKYAERLSRL